MLENDKEELRVEIARLREIEAAAKNFLRAVDRTADHTEWFDSISTLARAITHREDTES
jgi:hypothetical protein